MLVYKGYRFKVIRETITSQLFCAFLLMCDLNSIRRFCVQLQNTKFPRNKYCPKFFAKNLRRHLHTYVFGAINVLSYMKNFALRRYFNVKSPTIHGIKQKILLFTIHLRKIIVEVNNFLQASLKNRFVRLKTYFLRIG